ncbi:MAG: PQQ-binding-like beta-propeller repeat protein [Luteitalea sp.]|nr:PQQ-binding-like beta-propeller repeat protein [Luteitalea sp.]
MSDVVTVRALVLHALWGIVVIAALGLVWRPAPTDVAWPMHGGDPGHQQYSPLAHINRSNVQRLRLAWTYRTGDARADDRSQIQSNPIVVDGVLYATSPQLKAFALDAATGRELWRFDPFLSGAQGREAEALGVNRGLVHWSDGKAARRVFLSAGQFLYALDARTGTPIRTFGAQGRIDLAKGLGRDVSGLTVMSNTPGAIYEDLLIVGTRVSEGPGAAAPGHIRAYDVRSGAIRWTFRTIPWPGEYGYETWPPDAWARSGGANVWSGISVDVERGLVFLPTGSAAFDFWGGDRKGANLFANCVLALRADTGRRVWHYQVVHHDLWDRDLPAAPVLVTVTHGGRRIDAVAQVTKHGYVFLFDRQTGEPLFPVQERAVPASDLKDELAWPTQPFPIAPPPFARQQLTEAEVTSRTPAARAHVLERLRTLRTGQPFIPPSREGTVIFPGFDGGGEWGGQALDPASGWLYVNSNEMAWVLEMVEIGAGGGSSVPQGQRLYQTQCASCHGVDRAGAPAQTIPSLQDVAARLERAEVARVIAEGKGVMPRFGALRADERNAIVRYLFGEARPGGTQGSPRPRAPGPGARSPYTTTGYNRFFDHEGYPAVEPPWGTLNAIDLNAGTIVWQIPLGELPELTEQGMAPTGTENYGGPVVTAGGLIFIGATKDEMFRAFDKRTGELLWQTKLPAGGYATPGTYSVNGRQFVVIAAGGGKMGTKSGDAYVAFALP